MQSRPIFPAAGYLEVAAEALRSILGGAPVAVPLLLSRTTISQPLLMGSPSSPEGGARNRLPRGLSSGLTCSCRWPLAPASANGLITRPFFAKLHITSQPVCNAPSLHSVS